METDSMQRQSDNRKIACGFERAGIVIEFDAIFHHLEFSRRSIEQEIDKLKEELDNNTETFNPNDQGAYLDILTDAHWHAHDVIPRIQWSSEFLSVYSIFEHALNQLCNIVQRRSEFNLSFKDLSGQGITRARNYFVKVAGIDQPFLTNEWQRAKLLSEIRNAIAHRNGEIEYTPKNKKSLSAKLILEANVQLKQDIPEQEDAQIVIGYEFIKSSAYDLRKVCMDICNYELY